VCEKSFAARVILIVARIACGRMWVELEHCSKAVVRAGISGRNNLHDSFVLLFRSIFINFNNAQSFFVFVFFLVFSRFWLLLLMSFLITKKKVVSGKTLNYFLIAESIKPTPNAFLMQRAINQGEHFGLNKLI
jgi:hypothetical protein